MKIASVQPQRSAATVVGLVGLMSGLLVAGDAPVVNAANCPWDDQTVRFSIAGRPALGVASSAALSDWSSAVQSVLDELELEGPPDGITVTARPTRPISQVVPVGTADVAIEGYDLGNVHVDGAYLTSSGVTPGCGHAQPAIVVINDFSLVHLTDSEQRNVLVHETGHAFGFEHDSYRTNCQPSTVMYPTTDVRIDAQCGIAAPSQNDAARFFSWSK